MLSLKYFVHVLTTYDTAYSSGRLDMGDTNCTEYTGTLKSVTGLCIEKHPILPSASPEVSCGQIVGICTKQRTCTIVFKTKAVGENGENGVESRIN